MVYVSDLQHLIDSWQERMDTSVHPSSYKDGVMDCIYELNQLINRTLLDEMTEEDARLYMLEQDASNFKPEEFYATAI